MFVQIIEGKLSDPALWRRQSQKWRTDVRPGAIGFLGSTMGVTPDGVAVVVARFESADAAAANSERPEQGLWWEQTAPAFDDVAFHDCREVDLMFGGGSDDAGFVQIIEGRAIDPAAMRDMGQSMSDGLREARPDIIGGLVAWHGDRAFTQVVYFTSEEAARAGESQVTDNSGAAEWMAMMDGPMTFRDLREPEFA